MSRAWRTTTKVASWLVLAALAGFIAFCVIWRIDGGRWERVESPSMGTRAPVGSLLWVKPVDIETLQVGDFITFYPPGRDDATYSHAVYAINDDGTIVTKGVIPAPDPWALGADDIVGKVEMTWVGAGWVVQAAPILVIGGLLVGAAWSAVRPAWKTPIAMVGGAIVVTIAIVVHRPLLNAQQLASEQISSSQVTATYVGTGILPVRIDAPGGDSVVLHAGEVGSVTVVVTDKSGRESLPMSPALRWWWWAVVVLPFLAPGLRSLVTRDPAADRDPEPDDPDSTAEGADPNSAGANGAAVNGAGVGGAGVAAAGVEADDGGPTSLDDLLSRQS